MIANFNKKISSFIYFLILANIFSANILAMESSDEDRTYPWVKFYNASDYSIKIDFRNSTSGEKETTKIYELIPRKSEWIELGKIANITAFESPYTGKIKNREKKVFPFTEKSTTIKLGYATKISSLAFMQNICAKLLNDIEKKALEISTVSKKPLDKIYITVSIFDQKSKISPKLDKLDYTVYGSDEPENIAAIQKGSENIMGFEVLMPEYQAKQHQYKLEQKAKKETAKEKIDLTDLNQRFSNAIHDFENKVPSKKKDVIGYSIFFENYKQQGNFAAAELLIKEIENKAK